MNLPHVLAADLAPHYNAIIVGFFTLAGVYLTSRSDRSLRRRDFIVNALERIYGHALDAKEEVNRQHEAFTVHLEEAPPRAGPFPVTVHVFDDVARLVAIYAPSLRRRSDAAIACLEGLREAWQRARNGIPQPGPEAGPWSSPERALERFNVTIQHLLDAIRRELTHRL